MGLSQERLAEILGVSVNAIRGWESGERSPLPRYRQPLANALQINLLELNHLLGVVAPVQLNAHQVPTWLTHYESLVQAAGELREVELSAVPGLLQTKRYSEAAELASGVPLSPEQLRAAIDLRQARQEILHRTDPPPLQLTVLLGVGVVREVVGDPGVMAEQLDHLIDLAALPTVELRLLGSGRAVAATGGFELLTRREDPRSFLACTLDVGGARYHEDPDVVAKFDRRFDHLYRTALDPTTTLECIQHIRKGIVQWPIPIPLPSSGAPPATASMAASASNWPTPEPPSGSATPNTPNRATSPPHRPGPPPSSPPPPPATWITSSTDYEVKVNTALA